jgi:hypothetical protein
VQNGERVEPPLNVLSPENLHVGTGRELLDARRQQLPVRYGKCGRPAPGVIGRIELTNSIARTLGDPDVRTRRCEFVNKCKKRGHKG